VRRGHFGCSPGFKIVRSERLSGLTTRRGGGARMAPRLWAAGTLVALLVAAGGGVPRRRAGGSAPRPPPPPRAPARTAAAPAPARGRAFHGALRPGTYGAMAVGLVLALLLGLTPAGAWLVAQVGRPFGGHWLARALLGGLAVVFVGELVTLPFAAWRQSV